MQNKIVMLDDNYSILWAPISCAISKTGDGRMEVGRWGARPGAQNTYYQKFQLFLPRRRVIGND